MLKTTTRAPRRPQAPRTSKGAPRRESAPPAARRITALMRERRLPRVDELMRMLYSAPPATPVLCSDIEEVPDDEDAPQEDAPRRTLAELGDDEPMPSHLIPEAYGAAFAWALADDLEDAGETRGAVLCEVARDQWPWVWVEVDGHAVTLEWIDPDGPAAEHAGGGGPSLYFTPRRRHRAAVLEGGEHVSERRLADVARAFKPA